MLFNVLTLFPQAILPYIQTSIMERAITNKIIRINLHNLRNWAIGKHHTTDDTPFGGGGGMVMKPEPFFAAVEDIQRESGKCPVVLMTPQGRQLNHAAAVELSNSIGDYVLSGGELPALILMEAVTRLLPGALGAPNGAVDDSFASGLLEYPHYTRPAIYRDWEVPGILTSGNHQAVERWRHKQAWIRTLRKRPDLAKLANLDAVDIEILKEILREEEINLPATITNIIRGET